LAVRLFELFLAFPAPIGSLPHRFFLVLSWQRAVIATATTDTARHTQELTRYVHIEKLKFCRYAMSDLHVPNKVCVSILVFINK